MNIEIRLRKKLKNYQSPEIVMIKLDNEISLALESDPPIQDGESVNLINMKVQNPYKIEMG